MSAPIMDFSRLTPDQRIELAEQLWDSLEPGVVAPSDDDIAMLRTRRAEFAIDADPGEPWQQTIEALRKRGG
jgi:putative addiction module component (TIGR02574 family)